MDDDFGFESAEHDNATRTTEDVASQQILRARARILARRARGEPEVVVALGVAVSRGVAQLGLDFDESDAQHPGARRQVKRRAAVAPHMAGARDQHGGRVGRERPRQLRVARALRLDHAGEVGWTLPAVALDDVALEHGPHRRCRGR